MKNNFIEVKCCHCSDNYHLSECKRKNRSWNLTFAFVQRENHCRCWDRHFAIACAWRPTYRTPIFETKYTENGRENKTAKVILEMAVIYRINITTKIFPNLFAIMR